MIRTPDHFLHSGARTMYFDQAGYRFVCVSNGFGFGDRLVSGELLRQGRARGARGHLPRVRLVFLILLQPAAGWLPARTGFLEYNRLQFTGRRDTCQEGDAKRARKFHAEVRTMNSDHLSVRLCLPNELSSRSSETVAWTLHVANGLRGWRGKVGGPNLQVASMTVPGGQEEEKVWRMCSPDDMSPGSWYGDPRSGHRSAGRLDSLPRVGHRDHPHGCTRRLLEGVFRCGTRVSSMTPRHERILRRSLGGLPTLRWELRGRAPTASDAVESAEPSGALWSRGTLRALGMPGRLEAREGPWRVSSQLFRFI